MAGQAVTVELLLHGAGWSPVARPSSAAARTTVCGGVGKVQHWDTDSGLHLVGGPEHRVSAAQQVGPSGLGPSGGLGEQLVWPRPTVQRLLDVGEYSEPTQLRAECIPSSRSRTIPTALGPVRREARNLRCRVKCLTDPRSGRSRFSGSGRRPDMRGCRVSLGIAVRGRVAGSVWPGTPRLNPGSVC